MVKKCGIALILLVLATPAAAGDEIELIFRNHLQMNFVEQHVYVEREVDSGDIYRVTPIDQHRYLDEPVYASAVSVINAPMTHGEVGPYKRGKALGFTLGDWLAGTGKANYECEGDVGTVKATFDKLVPDAVYTMWYSFIPRPALDPFVALDIPLGSRDGSQSPFKTDWRGHATYEATFQPCLQLSGKQLDAMLAIAYHSDGKTYATSPGPFSTVTHVQLFVGFPIQN